MTEPGRPAEPSHRDDRGRLTRRAALAGGVGALAAALLAACSTETFADDQPAPGGQFAGDGSWGVYPPDQRQAPVAFSGTTEHGEQLSSESLLGSVVVVNFWYAACPPCRVEAGDLEALWVEHQDAGVQFVGVNIYDQAPTIHSFNAEFGITYPSILDVNSGSVLAAFADNVPPKAIPTTLVLDTQGRVASYILGVVDRSILGTMITDTAAEQVA